MKADNEDLKTKLKKDIKKLSKEVHDRDRFTKEIEILKKENARLKKNKPQEFNEERYSKYTHQQCIPLVVFSISRTMTINYRHFYFHIDDIIMIL